MEPRNVTELRPEDRAIFEYQGRFYDPLELNHKLQSYLAGRAEQFIKDFYRQDNPPASAQAQQPVKEAVHAAFGFQMFDPETGEGTTFEVWNGALEAYLDFFRRRAMLTDTSQTSVPPTEPPPTSHGGSLPETDSGSG